jgi:hypothetical protein
LYQQASVGIAGNRSHKQLQPIFHFCRTVNSFRVIKECKRSLAPESLFAVEEAQIENAKQQPEPQD